MKLSKLLQRVECISTAGSMEAEITALEYDSRKVTPGSVFVCLKGFFSDGHEYARMAVEKGAAALLVEDLPSFETRAAVIRVADTRKALAVMAATWFDFPAEKMKVIGLTGTKGKTTTAFMMKTILEQAGHKVGMIGTTGAYIDTKRVEIKNTTPESFELHSLFDKMVKAGCDYVVMEASSQGFKLRRTEGIRFDYGAFLNISPDHISPGEHESFEEYLNCKKMLFDQTVNAVVNVDADHWQEVTEAAVNPLTISITGKAHLWASEISNIWEQGILGSSFMVNGAYQGSVVLSMPGSFNVENALIAMGIAASIGIDFETVTKALGKVKVKGRAQVLPVPPRFATFIIDYAHNALSMESILHMLKSYEPKRLICLFGGGGNRPKQRRYDMGLIAAKYADLTVITTDNPRFEAPDVINSHILEGLNVYHGEYKIIMDRKEAIHYLLENCREGDIVVLIGKGHEEYQDVLGAKYFFSEEKIVEEYLAEKQNMS